MRDFRCKCPWDSLTVWVDGSVSHCGRTRPLGSLREVDFETFWNSEKLQRLRALFRRDALLQAGCMPTCNVLMAHRPDEFVPNQLGHDEIVEIADDELDFETTEERPGYMLLQLSDFCSLGCRMCCYGAGDLKEKLAKSQVLDDRVFDHLRSVWPSIETLEILGGELFDLPFDGHPLRRLCEDLERYGHPDLALKVVTNGKNLDERWARWLLQYDFVDVVSFSLDSADPDVYPKIRIGGSLERSLANLERLVRLRDEAGRRRPRVFVTALLGNHTASGLLHLAETARRLGADRLDMQPMNPMGEAQYHYDNNIFQPRFVDELRQLWSDLAKLDFPSNRADIVGMVESFLAHLEERDSAVRSCETIPQIGQYRDDGVVGPLLPRQVVVQPFVPVREHVQSVSLAFATYDRRNRGPIEVSVERERKCLARTVLDARDLRDNAWHAIDLGRVDVEPGVTHELRIRAPRASRKNCVALRGHQHAGSEGLTIGKSRRSERLAMKMF